MKTHGGAEEQLHLESYAVKLSPCLTTHYAMETCRGSGGIAARILLSDRGRWAVSFTPWPLYPRGKELPVPTTQEAGWGPEHAWARWWRGIERGCPCRSLVNILTELLKLAKCTSNVTTMTGMSTVTSVSKALDNFPLLPCDLQTVLRV